MIRTSTLFLCLLAIASADVPKKVPITQYARLWTDSPFTVKPMVGPTEPPKTPLDDFALCGVAPVTGGYSVTLLDKKKPDQRFTVEPDFNSHYHAIDSQGEAPDWIKECHVIEVKRSDSDDWQSTIAKLSINGKEAVFSFDPKLLALKVAPPPKQPPRPNGAPMPPQMNPVPQPVPPNPGGNVGRTPRPRVVPPQSR